MSKFDKKALRERLVRERLHLEDRLARAAALQDIMRIWLLGRPDTVVAPTGRSRASSTPCPPCTAGRKTAS